MFVSATVQQEAHHSDSVAFLRTISDLSASATSPTLVIAETVAAIARPTGNEALARHGHYIIESLPGLGLVPVDVRLARTAAETAAKHRLRGADAVFVAVAREHGTALVTRDKELLQRGPAVVPTMTPAEWLREHGG